MNKKDILWILIAALLSSFVFFQSYENEVNAQTVYTVYLSGQKLGQIQSKEELENYVDNYQKELKEKYQVSTIYLPNNLAIEKEITYNPEVSSVESIYEKFKEEAPFTMRGYEINVGSIKGLDHDGETIQKAQKIYVLDKEVFEEALKKTTLAFISEEEYNNYIEGNTKIIEEYGLRTEKIGILNNLRIKEANVSIAENIYLNSDDLSKSLLFGEESKTKEYVVQAGDNVEEVAYNNKLSTQELMIANPELTSEDNLLFEGQKLNVALIDPAFTLEKTDYVVEEVKKEFSVIVEYDPNLNQGAEKIKQTGASGTSKLVSKYKYRNGQLDAVERVSEEQITAPINKIIVRGTKYVPNIGDLGNWAWPTPYKIRPSSSFGWRGHKMHNAIDITGKLGESIFAANNGTVIKSEYDARGGGGNLIYINHNNGYMTEYAHLNSRSVVVGQTVSIGERIGGMGATGNASGVHLHFGVWRGLPLRSTAINPMLLYR